MKGLKIRRMTREELDVAVEWAAKEGWNPGLSDASVFWETDPEGFIVLEKDGQMIGSGSIISYNGNFGFMGFFIVRLKYRGRGLGAKLWFYRRDRLLSRLNKGAAIGMDGVFTMQPFYTKGGFKFSHRDLRMESLGEVRKYDQETVSKIKKEDFDLIDLLDKKCFGFGRTTFLKGWLGMPRSLALKYSDEKGLRGYGVIRKCRKGFKIGPLFAESFGVADELFKGLSSFVPGEPVYLDTPEVNKGALKLAKIYKMTEMFGCARMYYGKAPDLPYRQIYGVTTFELG